ncbi:MAG TPA: pilus assembly protein N-terminal domain-containing protein [Bryobacteraceae bacterium]|nr:pilus assembly protein N-terminal domain-containing protein [Bryobacteraceae bacterium]
MIIRFGLLAILLAFGSQLPAQPVQTPVIHALSLTVGKGELLQFGRDISKVVIAEPKIADAILVSPRDVMVNAKGAGQTTLIIWEPDTAPARYDITVLNDTTELGMLQRSLAAQLKSALPDENIEFSGNADAIVLSGKVANSAEATRAEAVASTHAKKVVNLLQTPEPRQILLQVKFASVDRTALSQFGFNLFSRNPTTVGATSTQQFQAPLFSQLQFQNSNLSNTNVNLSNLLNLFIFRPDLNLGATIQALQQQNLLQILAEPNLIVIEGSEASFLAGGEFPYPTITSTPTGGGIAPVVSVQFKKFGVQLNFTPTVTASGAINLKVRPEVSALDYNNAVTLDGFVIPAVSSRVAETEVNLKDGESFAIAGLIDNRVTQILNKVRGLGDIPILGNLFRSHSTQKTADELLVVVTPRFVAPLAPGEKASLPDIVAPFLPTVSEQKAVEDSKKKDKKDDKKPEFVGPRGH